VRSLRSIARRPVDRLLHVAGYELVPIRPPDLSDLDRGDADAYARVAPYTMTSFERVAALRAATRHIVRHRIPGAIVECGVWRGGSMMAIADVLLTLGAADRELYLFDTYAGMPPPTDVDIRYTGEAAATLLEDHAERERVLAAAPLGDVRRNVLSTGYAAERVRFVAGRVEETIPGQAPELIAVLRLDTDWYESTRHELVHLYPRLASGGALIVDDYGCWLGARQATDDYIAEHGLRLFLHRVDGTARLAIKP
jgi:O-methyltransferase